MSDGGVNYNAALNARMSKGVTPETNAVVALCRVCGPAEIKVQDRNRYFELLRIESPAADGEYFISFGTWLRKQSVPGDVQKHYDRLEDASLRPWLDSEYPEVAGWLDSVKAPLDEWVAGTKRPHFYSPLLRDPLDTGTIVGAIGSPVREMTRALTARSMRKVQDGTDLSGAWNDLAACLRTSWHWSNGPAGADVALGMAVQNKTCLTARALFSYANVPADLRQRCLRDLTESRVTRLGDNVSLYERCLALHVIEQFSLGPAQNKSQTDIFPSIAKLYDPKRPLDWNEAMREANRQFDRRIAIFAKPTLRESTLATQKLADDLRRLVGKSSNDVGFPFDERSLAYIMEGDTPAERGRRAGLWWTAIACGHLEVMARVVALSADFIEYTRVACVLSAFRRESGSYPPDLANLVPKYLDRLPVSVVSGQNLSYRTVGASYLISAFPPQQKPLGLTGAAFFDHVAYDVKVSAQNHEKLAADSRRQDKLSFSGTANDKKLALVATQPTLTYVYLSLTKPYTPKGLLLLANLPALRSLSLSGDDLDDTFIPPLLSLQNVDSLSLPNCPVTDAGLAKLVELKNLESIDLAQTRISDTGVAHLLKFNRLRNLNLAGNGISDRGVKLLEQSALLENIDLSRTKITDAGLASLAKLPKLTEIRLEKTAITDEGLKILQQMKRLSRLELSGSPVSDAAIEALKKALPDCSVGRD